MKGSSPGLRDVMFLRKFDLTEAGGGNQENGGRRDCRDRHMTDH